MVSSKDAVAGPKKREPAPAQRSGGWYAALALESSYSSPLSDEDRAELDKARQRLASSDAAEPAKKRLLEYAAKATGQGAGRFASLQAEAVINGFLDGKVPPARIDFEVRFMDAWCADRVAEFAEGERSALLQKTEGSERTMLDRMIGMAVTRSRYLMAAAVSALRVYYDDTAPQERRAMLEKAITVLESTNPG